MITAAERRAKIEKLRKEREAKEKERLDRQARQQEELSLKSTSDQIITKILQHNTEASEHLTSSAAMASTGQVQQNLESKSRLPLRVSSFVVELEIPARRAAEKYDKEIMCDIPDPKANRLQRISEDDEFDNFQDDFENRFERTTSQLNVQRRSSHVGSHYQKGLQKDNKLCPKCQEQKDFEDMKV